MSVADDLSGEMVTPPELADLAYDLKYELSDDDVNVLPMTDERYHEFQKVKAQILEALWDIADDFHWCRSSKRAVLFRGHQSRQ